MTPHRAATVADHMKTELVTLTPDLEIVSAVAILLQRHVSGACVLDESGVLAGVLSKRDCLKAALSASYYKEWGGTVADYMTGAPQTLDADLDIVAAAEVMIRSSYRRFPVLRHGRFVGQISRTDVLEALSAYWT
ncbi:CBS domain-containing protein [Bosea sp. (in: a-proteobacteria)]|uniref:CBS domain-containing protein n=1 Tax=Bosea sp. (in: a-proteobacteria) TaxID=1871050 RepID=UPI0026230998|nr:CBS domain-containing protein [Bosea sp. (in: a-proteobacteria)]MCO5093572.1 CBS domain-containing protein [Bosea sp. (in: a-proteobacteria)]